jgi:hypothetical protein
MVVFMVVLMLLLNKRSLIEPLERWIFKSVDWIWLLDSSPWLRKNTLVSRSKSMDFLYDSIVTNVSCFVMMFVVMFMFLLCQ